MLSNSTDLIQEMSKKTAALTSSLREATFAITNAKLQLEMSVYFLRELLESDVDSSSISEWKYRTRHDVAVLLRSFSSSTVRMIQALPQMLEPMKQLSEVMPISRAICQTQCGARHGKNSGLAEFTLAHCFQELFDMVLKQLKNAERELEVLANGINYLENHLPMLEESGRSMQEHLDFIDASVSSATIRTSEATDARKPNGESSQTNGDDSRVIVQRQGEGALRRLELVFSVLLV